MGNIILTGNIEENVKKEVKKVKLKIPYRIVEFEIPDDLKEGAEEKMFINAKKSQKIFSWYLSPFGVNFNPSEALDAEDFGYQLEAMPLGVSEDDEGIDLEHAQLILSIIEWNKMSVGQKLFCCLTFPQNMLSEFLFSENDERITKLIQNRFGNIHSNLILL